MRIISIIAILMLAACSYVPDWMGGKKDKEVPLPGERISVLPTKDDIKSDDSLAQKKITLPEPIANPEWTQEGGNAQNTLQHVAFSGQFISAGSGKAGGGEKWKDNLIPAPVVAEGKVFTMDAEGHIAAHNAANLSQALWVSNAGVVEDVPEIIGGGMAYSGGKLFVTTGRGFLIALEAASGKELWKKPINIPMRSAPRVSGGVLYAVTVDNQTFAVNVENGTLLWSHRGINETAGYLGMVTPSVEGNVVIAPYSSGEIFALNAQTGDVLWSDSLIRANRTSATDLFTGIDANPVIADGRVYAVSNGGVLAANDINTGRRLWEQKISSRVTPWLAGEYLFVVTSDNQIACLYAPNGRIKWVRKLPAPENAKETYSWNGPTLAGGRLYIVGAHGVMLALSPDNGEQLGSFEVPTGVYHAPVVAGAMMYLVAANATLNAYK